jgi:hypothetical protein
MAVRNGIAAALVVCASLLALGEGARAEDRDEFYAIARGDSRHRSQPPQAGGRSFGFPGFSLFGAAPRRDVPTITVRPQPNERPQAARPDETADRNGAGENTGGPRAYCVRTCDGFFFPAGPALSGEGRRAQQMTCNSLCPGAEVAVYTVGNQGTIEDAMGPRGQNYSALRTAFRFRQGVDRTCTCTGSATNGLARLPITHDFTLRAGDVVVTEAGVRVFSGGARFPYRAQDFVEARSYGRLPQDVQRRVAEIQAGIHARDTGSTAPVARLGRLGQARPEAAATPVAASLPVTSGTTADGVRVLDITRREATTLQ